MARRRWWFLYVVVNHTRQEIFVDITQDRTIVGRRRRSPAENVIEQLRLHSMVRPGPLKRWDFERDHLNWMVQSEALNKANAKRQALSLADSRALLTMLAPESQAHNKDYTIIDTVIRA